MAQSVAVVRGTLTGTSGGTSDFTRAGFGTPSAAIIIVGDTNDGTNPRDGARISIGFWDGTTQVAVGAAFADAQATMATRRDGNSGAVVTMPTMSGSVSRDVSCTVANITDGIRVTNSGTKDDKHCTVILLSGVSAAAKILTIANSNGGTVGSGSLGFEPRAALMATVGSVTSGATSAGILSLSVAEEGGTHRGLGFGSVDAAADAAVNQFFSETRLVGQVYNGANAWNAEVTTWGADSITLTTREGASGSDLAYLLILGGADLSYSVGTVTTRTSTGTDTISTTGIDPDAVLMMVGTTDTAGAIVSDSRANGLMIGAADDSGQYSHSIYDEDGAATSNTGTVSSAAQVLNLDSSASGSRTDVATATVELGTGGFTLDYSAADATARKGWFLAFGQSAGLGVTASAAAAQNIGTFSQSASLAADASLSAAQAIGAFSQSAGLNALASMASAQSVGDFSQAASLAADAGISAGQSVGAFVQAATATADAGLVASQSVGGFEQAAVLAADASIQAAQAVGGFAQAANIAADAGVSASQLVGDFGQAATLAADDTTTIAAAQAVGPFGQAAALAVDLSLQAGQPVEAFGQAVQAIVLPVAGLSAAQTVAGFGQSGQVDAGDSPANLEAAQQIGGFVQQATAQALVAAAADQAIGPFGQEARLITVTVNASADQQVGDFGQAAELGALPFVMGRLAARAAVRPSIAGAPRAVPSLRGNRGVR